jgi:DNA repair exonuclease SbcCD nuclease subunit
MTKPLAILVSDIHLSHLPPAYRKLEPDWYEAMRRHLRRLAGFAERLEVPVLCAGDVFHKWNSPPKLINFAIDEMPILFNSIPGQHDLPHHRLDAIHESAYQTLRKTREGHSSKRMKVHHFPWGCSPYEEETELCPRRFNIALLHRFVNGPQPSVFSTRVESTTKYIQQEFEGFDLVVCGDHHSHFVVEPMKTAHKNEYPLIINVGQFLCRNRGESQHPNMLLLYEDMTFDQLGEKHHLDIFDDEAPTEEAAPPSTDLEPIFNQLDDLVLESKNLEDVISMLNNLSTRSKSSIQLIRSILDERQ